MIRNLANKTDANIANCESEPIHIPGSIQYGYLIGIQGDALIISYCSENCTGLFNKNITEILGKSLYLFFQKDEIEAFFKYNSKTEQELTRPFVFTYSNEIYHCTSHLSGTITILEFELFSDDFLKLPDLYIQTKRFAYSTEKTNNLKSLCQDIADETRLITGYDRVMIYRFDKDYNGEVFAESLTEGMEPFLGLHYPHTDIPSQARDLYLRNLVRLIPDVNYTPIPIFGLETTGQPLEIPDLSLSFLRSVSPIHLQYLKNMGVNATFTISLIHNNKLWGLIACHHSAPKPLPYYIRISAHLQGFFLTSQLDVRQIADDFELTTQTEHKLNELYDILENNDQSITDKKTLKLLKELLNADGVVIFYNHTIFPEGILPDNIDIRMLINWLSSTVKKGTFQTANVKKDYPGSEQIDQTIAGIHYLPLSRNTGNCILWTRQEVEKTIKWGGNPHKAMTKNEVNATLSPRNSFDVWKETVKFQSKEWKKPEIHAASLICSAIQHQLHMRDLKEDQIRYTDLNVKLHRTVEELANMNWISTHDLKEPLRKIQFYASLILERTYDEIPESVKVNIAKMQGAANRMQLLIEDLMSYSKIINEEVSLQEVDLNIIFKEVLLEFQENIEEKDIVIQLSTFPTIQGISFQIRQLFINLIGNAIKFSKENAPNTLKIEWQEILDTEIINVTAKTGKAYHKIIVSDNGIGFDKNYKDKLFKVFQRLHSGRYAGSGVGLAICKKIAERHMGFIEAEGEEGKGATFSVYLPVETPGLVQVLH